MLRLLIAISLNLLLLPPLALPSTGGVVGRNADTAGDAGRYQRYPTALGRGRGVGLVLSGGGARGLAHIGVIKALEENHIPIDYISGTSIGAIVGVFYALGYTPDEMLQLFKSQEFKYWSSGDIPERYRYYFLQYGNDARLLTLSVARQDSLLWPLAMRWRVAILTTFSAHSAAWRAMSTENGRGSSAGGISAPACAPA